LQEASLDRAAQKWAGKSVEAESEIFRLLKKKGRCQIIMSLLNSNSESEYGDVSTVQSQQNDLIPEEFPEGPYGSSLEAESIGKSSPWKHGQNGPRPFGYENLQLHEGSGRDYPAEDLMTDEQGER
jgi:hypothetical protein